MGLLINVGRMHSRVSLFASYIVAAVFAILSPVVIWMRHARSPKPRPPLWRPVTLSAACMGLAALIVVISRWYDAKVQSSEDWATFEGASTVAGAAGSLLSDRIL